MTRFQRASVGCLALVAAACGQDQSVSVSNEPTSIDDEPLLADNAAATAMASTSDGVLYVAGWAQNNGQPSRWVVRRWNRAAWETIDDWSVDGDHSPTPLGIAIASDGAVYVGGSIDGDGWDRTWLVRKWDGQSWTESDRYPGSSGFATLSSMSADAAGHVYAIGYDLQFNPDSTSTFYNVVRTRTDAGWSDASRVLEPDGLHAGWQWSAVNAQGQLFGASYMRVSSLLSEQFNEPLPWASDAAYSIGPGAMAVDAAGQIYLANVSIADSTGAERATLLAWNGAGWTTLDSVANEGQTDYAALTIDSNGVLFAGGNVEGSNGSWFVRTWNGQTMTTLSTGAMWSYLTALASDGMGHVYAAGGVSHDRQTEHWVVRLVQ